MAVEESLLTDAVRALVGQATEPVPVTITRRAVEKAREMIDMRATGRFEGEPGVPVPGYVMAALEAETGSLQIPELLPDTLLVSNEWLFERPLRLGETLTISLQLADLTERFGGQFGYSIHVRTEVSLRDDAGSIVARGVRTLMQYDAAARRGGDA